MRTQIRRLTALTWLFLRPVLRQPMVTALVVMMPMAFVLFARIIGGKEMTPHALYGTLIVFATNVGVVSLPQLVVGHRIRELRSMFIASPVGPLSYAAGMGLSRLLWALPGLIGIVAIVVAAGHMSLTALPLAAVVILISWMTGVMMGFMLAIVVTDIYLIGQVSNITGILLSLLPPVYYPLSTLSEPWQWLAMAVPTANAAQLLRVAGGIATSTPTMLAIHWAILLGYCLVFGLLVVKSSTWQED